MFMVSENYNFVDFNSHAHVERDRITNPSGRSPSISTHTLTWSVTTRTGWARMTHAHFNSHAHVERDYFD